MNMPKSALTVLHGDYTGPTRVADVVLTLIEGGKGAGRAWNGKLVREEKKVEIQHAEPLNSMASAPTDIQGDRLLETACSHAQWVLISYANPPNQRCRIQCLSGCAHIVCVSDETFAHMNSLGLIKQIPGPPPFIGTW